MTAATTPSTPQATTKSFLEKTQSSDKIIAKECFVSTDVDSQLYRFTVDGRSVDGVRISPEVNCTTIIMSYRKISDNKV